MTLEGVIFDWGGTLSVYAALEMEDMWRLAARHIAPDREDEVCAQLVAVEQASWDRISVDQRSTTLAELLAHASSALGLDVAEALLEEAGVHHLDSWTPHIRHEPDALATLRALRERGQRIGLLSNTHWPRSFHEHFLERDGLASLIDARCYTSELERTKPHGDAFAAVMRQLGLDDPAGVLFVGDRLFDDVWGARNFGMTAVWKRNAAVPHYDVEPDATIDDLSELVPLIDAWVTGDRGAARMRS